jgi:hypothetical protein
MKLEYGCMRCLHYTVLHMCHERTHALCLLAKVLRRCVHDRPAAAADSSVCCTVRCFHITVDSNDVDATECHC